MSDSTKGMVVRRRRPQDQEEQDATTTTDSSTAPEGQTEAEGAEDATGARETMRSESAPAEKTASAVRQNFTPPARREEPVQPPIDSPEESGPMPSTDDFAALFGQTDVEVRQVERGDRVSARVVEINDDAVFVSLGAKAEGVIERGELVDNKGELKVAVGDEIDAWVVSTRGGTIQLSTALRGGDAGREVLADAAANRIPVEGRVVGQNKGGFEVEVLGARAFCPVSQIDIGFTEDPSKHLNQTYTFYVSRVDEGGRNVVISRRDFLEAERARMAEETLAHIKSGDTVSGRVARLMDFGAFIDLGGVDGFVHISELSWVRFDHPREFLSEGDLVNARVLEITPGARPGDTRISLSMKELEEDPFIKALRDVQVGDTLNGTVSRLMDFGAFIEVAPGVEGLCHISELDPGRRVRHPSEVVQVGDTVQVMVLNIDPRKRQIGLSMKRLMDDPWSKAALEIPPGTKVQGTVENVQSFGIFVELSNGLTGLLPMSQLAPGEDRNAMSAFAPGKAVEATVLDIDADRQRLTLTRREDAEPNNDAAVRASLKNQDQGSFGTFGELLKNVKVDKS